jgi:hypothetical protein
MTIMFRLFKTPKERKNSATPSLPLTASLRVPAFGIVDLPWPSDLPGAQVPDVAFRGSLDVKLPPGPGSRPVRIARITISFQVVARLEKEGGEEHVLYEVEEEVLAPERVIYGPEQ